MESRLVGQPVYFRAFGGGRSRVLRGTFVAFVFPGTSNAEAIEQMKQDHSDIIVRRSFIRCNPKTSNTLRALVIVDVESKRSRPARYIYAPNWENVWPG
jgi:hypothetical protein